MEKVEKNRELIAWILLGAAVVAMLTGFTSMEAMKEGVPDQFKPELSVLARAAAPRFAPISALTLAALAAWLCTYWRNPSNNAKIINLIGLIITGVGALLTLIYTFIGMGDAKGMTVFTNLLALVANLAMLAALAGFFFVGYQKFQNQQFQGHPGQGQMMPGQADPGAPAGQQPTWQPEQASGGAWNRAGDAATGAGASNWGTPGQQSQGWQPSASPQPSAAEQPAWGQQSQASAAPANDWGQQSQPSAPANDWGQQSQPSAPANDWGQQSQPSAAQHGGGWAPQGDQQAPDSHDEGTILRPNPGNDWRGNDQGNQPR